jgi:tRNA threonylcarbamoyladenosine biosynthesis protein TsaE
MSKLREIKKADLPAFAVELVEEMEHANREGATILALKGDLGAGKTTLVQAIGNALGVTETITSPTFTIMKQYTTGSSSFQTLVHMDAYRIDDESELRPLHFAELLEVPKTLVCIEWPEKIKVALPAFTLVVELVIKDEETRTVQVSPL